MPSTIFSKKNPDDKHEYFSAFAGKEHSLSSVLNSSGKHIQDFQAIVALPFFHVGSEKLWIGPDWNPSLITSFHISYQTGLPIVDVMMSRTSWSQTFESIRLADGPFSQKKILDRFSDKPLLILADTQYTTDINELYLTTMADSLLTWDRFRIYSLSKSRLLASQKEIIDSTVKIAYQSQEETGIILPPGSDSFLYVNHFDNGLVEGKMGKGFYQEKFEQDPVLDLIPLPQLKYDHKLVINIWAKVNDYKYNGPSYLIDQFNADSQHVYHQNIGAKLSTMTEKGLWLLTEKVVDIHPQAAFMTVRIDDGKASNRNYMALDELALYPVHATYFYKKDKALYLNNRKVR
ncbi:MAG: hypothetical protein KL787_06150 [Taibaiella sp.]|nr:hypothetical protein [Taibaiella sp.]